jgi:hypothetical protein
MYWQVFGGCSEQRDVGLKEHGFEGEIGALYVRRRFQRRGITAYRRLACCCGSWLCSDSTMRPYKEIAQTDISA